MKMFMKMFNNKKQIKSTNNNQLPTNNSCRLLVRSCRLVVGNYKLPFRRGFTLIEVLIFLGIFTAIMVVFLTVLISVSSVQIRNISSNEVNQQSQFLLSTIQRYVESSSLIDMPADVTTSTLKLRMARDSEDPTYIYLNTSDKDNIVYLKQTNSGTPQALTTSRVKVTTLNFTKKSNPGAKDTVNISFVMEYNTDNIKQKFVRNLFTSIARVSAATFDSDIRASTTNTYKIGAQAGEWQSINNTLFFSGSNVGIGVSSPQMTLEINGGLRLNTTAGRPTCSATTRGTFWVIQSGSGVKDYVQVCVKNASDTYEWVNLY
jgi:Tfp pilus assembly protein PilV